MPNRSPLPFILFGLVAAGVLYIATQPAAPPPDRCVGPNCPICPITPTPTPSNPKPKPKPPRCPNCPQTESFHTDRTFAGGNGSVVDGRVHDGQPVTADLPGNLWIKNIPSRKNGAGMCVMSAIEMAGLYQGVPGVRGIRDWCAREDGGASPPKVDDQIKRYYQQVYHTEPPPYFQYEGRDPGPVLDQIDRNGWAGCHTYGTSPRYGGGVIHHMVTSARFRGNWATVLDNNFVDPPEQTYEWMSTAEAVRRIGAGGNSWVFCWMEPGPPMAPHN